MLGVEVLKELYNIVVSRVNEKPEGSYTAYLASRGREYVARKIGEEAIEVVISSLTGSKDEVIYEVSDLLYHLIVLMVLNDITLDEVLSELKRRMKS